MIVHIINGPNLNLTGTREPEIYGTENFEEFIRRMHSKYPQAELDYYQSNVEGELVNRLQQSGITAGGIILNAGGYTHTSVAIADAVAAITTPVIEVHLSNIFSREPFRQQSLSARVSLGVISGFGMMSYELAILKFLNA